MTSTICISQFFYRWQREFFVNASLAFKKINDKATKRFEKKIKDFKDILSKKNGVLPELMKEHNFKKKYWRPLKNV